MIDPKILDDLAKRFAETIPSGFWRMQADLEKNFHALLQAAFARMDLVTREEFEVQQGVLARTRAKLEAMEQQVAALEAKLAARRPRSPAATKPKEGTP